MQWGGGYHTKAATIGCSVGVCINGATTLCPLQASTFTLSLPTGSTATNIFWDGFATITTQNGGLTAIFTPDDAGPNPISPISVQLTLTKGTTVTSVIVSGTLTILGIRDIVSIIGASTVEGCCTNSITYTVVDFGDGNNFTWALPVGWAFVSGQGTSTVTVQPNISNTGGVVSCTVRINNCNTSYAKTASKTITRIAPVMSGTITGLSPICINKTQQFICPTVCGGDKYYWTVPVGWKVNGITSTGASIVVSGAAGNTVNITTSATIGSSFTVSAQGGTTICGASNALSKTIIVDNVLPPTPGGLTFYYYNFGKYKVKCLSASSPYSFSYYWSTSNLCTSCTPPVNTYVDYPNSTWDCTRLFGLGRNSANVKTQNFCGVSATVGTCYITPNNNPPCELYKTDETIILENVEEQENNDIKIYPNPSKGEFFVEFSATSNYEISVMAVDGKQIIAAQVTSNKYNFDLSQQPSGTYYMAVAQDEKVIFFKRINLTK